MNAYYRTLRAAIHAFIDDDGSALAGHIAFSMLLGLFPLVILASNTAALILGPARGEAAIDQLFVYAPEHVARTLEPVLHGVIAGSGGGVLTLSALAAVWFSSNAFEALRTGFDRAYGGAGRGWFKGRLVSILCVIISVFVSLFLGVTIVLGPLLLDLLSRFLAVTIPGSADPMRYAAGLLVFVIFLLFLHRVLPRHGLSIRRLIPGVLVTTLIWLTAATLFSIYLAWTPTYVSTYGALAGVVITLMFFYITAMAVLLGAEINAALGGRTRN